MHDFKHFNSTEDNSVNFVFDKGESHIESRFVKRNDDYFIVYLSSQNGCNRSCRFCHLTQTGQTEFDQTSLDEYLNQAKPVLDHYENNYPNKPEKYIYYNFMARGEPLLNPLVRNDWGLLRHKLIEQSEHLNLDYKFKLSTIIPNDTISLSPYLFSDTYLYYSLYSLSESFRKKWLPKAMPTSSALHMLSDFEEKGGNIVFHWAFIDGQNDDEDTVHQLGTMLQLFDKPRVNVVRYNPYSTNQGKESPEHIIARNVDILQNVYDIKVKVIQRVGFDVKASCGMFVT